MNSTRRHFLKIAGLSALGLGASPLVNAIASNGQPKVIPDPQASSRQRVGYGRRPEEVLTG